MVASTAVHELVIDLANEMVRACWFRVFVLCLVSAHNQQAFARIRTKRRDLFTPLRGSMSITLDAQNCALAGSSKIRADRQLSHSRNAPARFPDDPRPNVLSERANDIRKTLALPPMNAPSAESQKIQGLPPHLDHSPDFAQAVRRPRMLVARTLRSLVPRPYWQSRTHVFVDPHSISFAGMCDSADV